MLFLARVHLPVGKIPCVEMPHGTVFWHHNLLHRPGTKKDKTGSECLIYMKGLIWKQTLQTLTGTTMCCKTRAKVIKAISQEGWNKEPKKGQSKTNKPHLLLRFASEHHRSSSLHHLSSCWWNVSCDHVKGGCLAGSIWTKKSENLSLLNTKVQVFDNCFSLLSWAKSLP